MKGQIMNRLCQLVVIRLASGEDCPIDEAPRNRSPLDSGDVRAGGGTTDASPNYRRTDEIPYLLAGRDKPHVTEDPFRCFVDVLTR